MMARSTTDVVNYDGLVDQFNDALISKLRNHAVGEAFLEYWVADADPLRGIPGMVDSARIAGWSEITIRFSRRTVPAELQPGLEAVLARLCTATLTEDGDGVLLRATALHDATGSAPVRVSGAARPYWQASLAADSDAAPQVGWSDDDELADVHPALRDRLRPSLARIFAKDTPSPAAPGLLTVQGTEGATSLTFVVDPVTSAIADAWYQGVVRPSEQAILNLLCQSVRNLPIQEAADHATLRILHSLIDEDALPPVAGVVLPVNAGPAFLLSVTLARRAYDAYRAQTGQVEGNNYYFTPPQESWLALSEEERNECVAAAIQDFAASAELKSDDLMLLRVERNKFGVEVRVVIGFADSWPASAKPSLMRRLERYLRRHVEPTIDLVADRAKDSSQLRRLS